MMLPTIFRCRECHYMAVAQSSPHPLPVCFVCADCGNTIRGEPAACYLCAWWSIDDPRTYTPADYTADCGRRAPGSVPSKDVETLAVHVCGEFAVYR